MTVEEAKTAKQIAEKGISDIISEFEKVTSCRVTDINFVFLSMKGYVPTKSVSLEVKL